MCGQLFRSVPLRVMEAYKVGFFYLLLNTQKNNTQTQKNNKKQLTRDKQGCII